MDEEGTMWEEDLLDWIDDVPDRLVNWLSGLRKKKEVPDAENSGETEE